MQYFKFPIIIISFALLTLCGCSSDQPPTPVDRLAELAKKAAREAAEMTVDPHEITMIEYRRDLMGQARLQLYVIFMNDMGQPVDYFVTSGKCTSSNKRLTDGTKIVSGDRGSYRGNFDVPAASEDGTHGESDEYIYCRSADGKYKQWNGDYYVSDYPIELTIKPLVINSIIGDKSGIQSQQ